MPTVLSMPITLITMHLSTCHSQILLSQLPAEQWQHLCLLLRLLIPKYQLRYRRPPP